MKKIRLLSMQKFTSATVYFSILSTGLAILLQVYTHSVLSGDDRFTNPLIFAIIVLALGFLTSLIYWLFNLLLKVIVSVIMRKETNGLSALSYQAVFLYRFLSLHIVIYRSIHHETEGISQQIRPGKLLSISWCIFRYRLMLCFIVGRWVFVGFLNGGAWGI